LAHLALCADLQAGLLASPDFAARSQSVIGGPAPASPPGEAR